MCKESLYLPYAQCKSIAQAKKLPFLNSSTSQSAWCIFNGNAWLYTPTLTMCNLKNTWPKMPTCLTKANVCYNMMKSRAGSTNIAFQRWWHPWFSEYGYCILLDITDSLATWKILWTNNPSDQKLCHTYVCHCSEEENAYDDSYDSYQGYENYDSYESVKEVTITPSIENVTCSSEIRQNVLFTWIPECLDLATGYTPDPNIIRNLKARGKCCPRSIMS